LGGKLFFFIISFHSFNLIWADKGVPAFIENNVAADIPQSKEIILIKAHQSNQIKKLCKVIFF